MFTSRRTKPPINKAERAFFDLAVRSGWTPIRRGWPDFFCMKPGGIGIFVEVKPKRGESLKRDQAQVMRFLASLGAECYRWSPEGGFQRVYPSTPDDVLLSKRVLRKIAQE